MELIKKIKQTEAQAQEIVAQARADSTVLADQQNKSQVQSMDHAQQDRKKSIDAAVSHAASQGEGEIEDLRAQAEQARNELREKTKPAIAGAVGKVVDFLKG